MKFYKFLIAIVLVIFVISFFLSGVTKEPVETLSVNSSLGFDMEESTQGMKMRSVTFSQYLIAENGIKTITVTDKAKTLSEIREEMQKSMDKKLLIGLEKVYIIGADYAKNGIDDIMDIFFRNPEIRDSTLVCICDGKAEDIMNIETKGHPSAGDFIEGLIKYSKESNFFPDNYKLIDAYLRISSEGRNLVLPYIGVKENRIEIVGLALFKGSKMIGILPKDKIKQHNLLRENNLMGVITLQESSNKYLGLYAKSKRKVKCYKENGKYKFIIDLKITGDMIINQYEPMLIDKPEKKKEIEAKLKDNLQKELQTFIEEFKSKYKVDTLELGKIAVAKYGRNTGVDWDEVVSSSDIEVNVSLKINKFGRGDY